MVVKTRNSKYKLGEIDEKFSEIWKTSYLEKMVKDGIIKFTSITF